MQQPEGIHKDQNQNKSKSLSTFKSGLNSKSNDHSLSNSNKSNYSNPAMELGLSFNVSMPVPPKLPQRILSKVVVTEINGKIVRSLENSENEINETKETADDDDFDEFDIDEQCEWDDTLSSCSRIAALDSQGLSVKVQNKNPLLNQSRRALLNDNESNMSPGGFANDVVVAVASQMDRFKCMELNKSKLLLRGMSQMVVLPLYKSESDLSTVNDAECECQ